MRIETNLPVGIDASAGNTEPRTLSAGAAAQSVSDRAEVGKAADQIQALVQQALNGPEVRQSLVDSVRQAIQAGAYNVSSSQLADAIVAHRA